MSRVVKFVVLMLAVVLSSNVGLAATGDDCTDPIVITAGPLPYTYDDVDQTTCGRGNTYSSTDLGSYDGGEDTIYTLVLDETTDVTIEMDPNGTTYTGLGLFTGCPAIGNSVSTVTGSSGTTVKKMNAILDAGTYYIMVDTWPSPNCVASFDLTVSTATPPPPPDPVNTFPYFEDYESGVFPGAMVPITGSQSDLTVDTYAGYNSTYGAMFEGGPSSWGSTPADATTAFAYTDHVAKMEMVVEPTGELGILKLEFDLVQRYSFNAAYEWFRVLVNGVPVPDEDGNLYHQASSSTGDQWVHLVYDLTAYRGLETFDLTFENSAKYHFGYYQDGDLGCVDNVSLYYLFIGDVEGYVLNGDGLSIAGADVWMDGYPATQTDATGYYFLSQVDGLEQDVNVSKDGYNITTDNFSIAPGETTSHDFTVTKPDLTINPLFFYETLNPNKYLTEYLGVLNTGDGEGYWEAVINYPSEASGPAGWLTLSDYDGTVPGNGGIQNIGVNFDAAGTEAGNVYTAEIEITTDPDVGTFVVPVAMTIFLDPATDLAAAFTSRLAGKVALTWQFSTSNPTFQYFEVVRDGVAVGTTTDLFYTDTIPAPGTYCYEVFPVFSDGKGEPAGPECVGDNERRSAGGGGSCFITSLAQP